MTDDLAVKRQTRNQKKGRSGIAPAHLTQEGAADWLGICVKTFTKEVDVEAVPVTMPRPGKEPILRYRVVDLEAWVERCRTFRQERSA